MVLESLGSNALALPVYPLSFDLVVHEPFSERPEPGAAPPSAFVKWMASEFSNYIDAACESLLAGESTALTITAFNTRIKVAVNYGTGANVGLTPEILRNARKLFLDGQYERKFHRLPTLIGDENNGA